MKNLSLSAVVTTILSVLVTLAAADDHGVVFLYPDAELTIHLNDTVNVTYTSNFSSPQLLTFCYPPGDPKNIKQELLQRPTPYNGSALITIVFPNITKCWFDLRPGSSAGEGANCIGFNVINTVRATPTTWSIGSTPTLEPTTSTNSSTPQNTDPASSSPGPKTSPSSSKKKKSGTGTIIGVVVGIVAALGFIIIAVLVIYRRRRAKLLKESQQGKYESAQQHASQDYLPGETGSPENQYLYAQHATEGRSPSELSTTEQRSELGSEQRYEMPVPDQVVAPVVKNEKSPA